MLITLKLTPWISKASKVGSAQCRDHQDKHASCTSQTFTRTVPAAGGAGSPRHLRTLMAPLIDLLLETQNAGEVDDPSPGGTSGCHLLSGCILHHFHIRVFPRPLSAKEMRNWQVNSIFKVFQVSQILPHILEKEVASMCQICTYWGGGGPPHEGASQISLFSRILLLRRLWGPSKGPLDMAQPRDLQGLEQVY